MKHTIFSLILLISYMAHPYAQEMPGIRFENGLSWTQVKEKAKMENKNIFLDAFTTWCEPCRRMEQEIFPQPSVGDFFNRNFINIKVQMDVTQADGKQVRDWYVDAKNIHDTYKIDSYPTYLFFNSQGELVHRTGASFITADFIKAATGALSPYLIQKNEYANGKKEPDFLKQLIKSAQSANDKKFLQVLVNEYLGAQTNLLTEENIKFIEQVTAKSTDPGFQMLLNKATEADAILGKGTSKRIVKHIIYSELVFPYIRRNGKITDYGGGMIVYSGDLNKNVNWGDIREQLNNKYPELSEEILLEARIEYSQALNDWVKFTEIVSGNLKNLDSDLLNRYAWAVFSFCEDKKLLKHGMSWSKKALVGENENNLGYLYTYANLTYKAGNKKKAIEIIEKAIKLSGETNGGLTNILAKMKKGENTW